MLYQEKMVVFFKGATVLLKKVAKHNELGNSKYDYQNKETTNYRNGHYSKTITASDGEFVVDIPRDNDISSIEDKILSVYAKGMITRDIQNHIQRYIWI